MSRFITEEREERIAFVPVRPDWMDNKGLMGYYNLLDEKYHATPLLRLLIEAGRHPEKPYFVIFDEMNLAKVETVFFRFSEYHGEPNNRKPSWGISGFARHERG